jgi:dTDP-4-dehydrorhamnose reductase
MTILVTGVNGQLGNDVVRVCREKGINVIGIGRAELDITSEKDVKKLVSYLKPSIIIHCAAYTAVDNAEGEKEICWSVNVEGTQYLAEAANIIGAKFLYISTDYVFDGKGDKPFAETDEPNPVSTYGRSKYEGELKVRSVLDEHFIVRTSWVFGINGKNFIKTMLKISKKHEKLDVISDQIGSPTYTYDLAKLLVEIVQSNKYGTYHASNEGYCSWAEFSKEIFKQAKVSTTVNEISTEEYPTKAIRPKNSKLSKQKLVDNGFDFLPPWEDAVKRYLKELTDEVT